MFLFPAVCSSEISAADYDNSIRYKNLGQFNLANRIYYLALKNDNNDIKALYGLADSFYRQHNFKDSLEWLNKVIDIDPTYKDALLLRARLYMFDKKWQFALNDYLSVNNSNPEIGDVYLELNDVYLKLGDENSANKALQDYNKLNTK